MVIEDGLKNNFLYCVLAVDHSEYGDGENMITLHSI